MNSSILFNNSEFLKLSDLNAHDLCALAFVHVVGVGESGGNTQHIHTYAHARI